MSDRAGEDRLVRQFEPACLKYARTLTIEGHDYEDLVQEMRIAALLAIRSWRPNSGAVLSTWVINRLRMTARNLAVNEKTKNRFCGRNERAPKRSLQDRVPLHSQDEGETTIGDLVAGDAIDPHEEVCQRELVRACTDVAGAKGEMFLDILTEILTSGPKGAPRGVNANEDSVHKRYGISRQRASQHKQNLLRDLSRNPEVLRITQAI